MKAAVPSLLTLAMSISGVAAQPATPPTFGDHIDTVQVTAPKIPLDKAIYNFVKSYAAPSMRIGKISKWWNGICPTSMGLMAEQNLGVAALIKQIASQVGAPVETKEPCTPNVTIVFTRTPQDVLDDIAKNHTNLLGYHDVAQIKQITTISHPIQAWYATATRDNNGELFPDNNAPPSAECESARLTYQIDESEVETQHPAPGTNPPPPVLQRIIPDIDMVQRFCGGMAAAGNRLNDGLRSEISDVTIIVDVNKLNGLTITPVSNYIAMLALSQTQAYETCQPLPSVTNLMTSGCDTTLQPKALSEGDIAYLKALYKMNPDMMLGIQQSSIAHQMEESLGSH